ncbi:MAG: hypothetical protein KDI33_02420 [Halioglobus sp.]|nr:hypothetical protein [Halioglobus sp.]
MNRFNLTFSGEILAGEKPEQVKLRFAEMFGITDRVRLERFFSGETIILRRNLERKDAAHQYHQLQLIGAAAALVKVTTSELADGILKTPSGTGAGATTGSKAHKPAAHEQAAAEANLRREEEQARQTAEKARLEAEASVLREAKRAEAKRLEEEETARKKALKAESRRKATEEAAQRKAKRAREKAEKAQRKTEEAARRKAELEEKKRLAAEEEARRKAELAEQKRLADEAEARQKAELEEKKRLAAEEEARRKAEREEQKRLAAEEEARREAELAEKKRLAAEAEARLKAELEAKKRLAAEEEARRKAELAEKKRLEDEAEALRKAALAERKRQAAEKKARRKAALEKKKRLAAEMEARRLAEAEERKRLAAEAEARKAAAKAKEAAKLQAELEEKALAAAAQAAQIRAEAQRLAGEAQRKSDERRKLAAAVPASKAPPTNDSTGTTPERSAEGLPTARHEKPQSQKHVRGRVKTVLEVPLRQGGQTPEVGTPAPRKRLSGAPNLYKIRPFRNSQAVQTRAAHARQRMRQAYALGGFALAILCIAGGIFLQNGAYPVVTGASAVAIDSNSAPVLLAGDSLLLHDRAGVSTTEVALGSLGVKTLQPPMVFDNEGALFALGRLGDGTSAHGDKTHLLRCDLALSSCDDWAPQLNDTGIDAFVINALDGSVLLANRAAGILRKADREGNIVASADVDIPAAPVLRLHGGLLLMNSAEGPAISVFRYENSAFAQQLDEILLLPPAEEHLEASRVSDFIWSGNAWWVILHNPVSGTTRLHRFDEDWNYLESVPLAAHSGPLQLIRWGEKTLVNDPDHPAMQRFNAEGVVEAPFVSRQLQTLIDTQQRRASLASLAWNGGLLVCALAALMCFGLGYLHSLRALVYRPRWEQGAEPLDDYSAAVQWIEPVQNRQLQLRRTGMYYGTGVLGALLIAIASSISVWQMAALLLVLSGPAMALLLLSRQPIGHIGVLGDRLLLVDHSGQYHLAGGPRLHYRGPFLSIDDIVVFSGSRLLPAFCPGPLQKLVRPPALGGIKVDHRTIAIKLLESRHPLALGAIAMVATAAAGALLLLLQGIF